MRPPCEVLVLQLLPALRALISQFLIQDHGFTQSQVAQALGVTQASVSRSLTNLKRFEQFYSPSVRRAAESFARQLSEKNLSLEESIAGLCDFCQSQKIGGIVCHYHRRENPNLQSCDACGRTTLQSARIQILRNLAKGAKLLQDSKEFTSLIPQVQSQLVMSLQNAENIEDVAGFPSRIVSLHQRAFSFTQPEFGASEHLSRILLLVQHNTPDHRAAIVFKYEKNLERVLKETGLSFAEVSRKVIQDRRDTDEALLAAIKEVLQKKPTVDVIIDKGLVGIEPVTYLFAQSAENAAKRAISLAKRLVNDKNSGR